MKSLLLLCVLSISAGLLAQQPAAAPATAQPKPVPRAKTKPEFKDFSTASTTTGGAAMEAAADAFATKYPDSDLRAQLYLRAVHEYQSENQTPKVLAMAENVLTLDPENTLALVLTASVLSDQVNPSEPDAAKKIVEIKNNASKALETIDQSFTPPPGATPEQVAAQKNMLKSMAHSAIGMTDLKISDYAEAETELKASAELNKAHPDPFTFYSLAVAQERLKKYPEALASTNEGLKYAGSDPNIASLLQKEHDNLTKLAAQPIQ